MMQFENPTTFVRAMKGAPISILVAFTFCRQAMTALELQEWTGYRGDAITPAIRLLVSTGWLTARSPRGPWCLCEGRQVPLQNVESVLNGYLPSSSSSSNRKLNLPSNHEEEQEEDESVLNGLMAALDAVGIREPKRSQLAKLPHVTPELISAHVRQCKAEGHPLGTAISRIANNWEPLDRFKVEPDQSLEGYYGKMFALRNRERDDEE
jgi:hypothetical protein